MDILKKYDIKEDNENSKGKIKKSKTNNYKYYARIANINIDNYNLDEIKNILKDIDSYIKNIRIKI